MPTITRLWWRLTPWPTWFDTHIGDIRLALWVIHWGWRPSLWRHHYEGVTHVWTWWWLWIEWRCRDQHCEHCAELMREAQPTLL